MMISFCGESSTILRKAGVGKGKMVAFPLVISRPWHYIRRQRKGTWEAGTLEGEG